MGKNRVKYAIGLPVGKVPSRKYVTKNPGVPRNEVIGPQTVTRNVPMSIVLVAGPFWKGPATNGFALFGEGEARA